MAELTRLRQEQPDLASAVDLQIELIKLERRIRSRLPLPSSTLEIDAVAARLATGRPILRFEDVALNWSDFRFEALDEEDYRRTETLSREADRLEPMVTQWFAMAVDPAAAEPPPDLAGLEAVVQLAMRPFLARSAEAFAVVDCSAWTRGCCPVCGGEPEFATIIPSADRLLICSRCTTRWRFDPLACPFCGNADRDRVTSFATRDGRYRIYACDDCRRYLKVYDARHAARPVLLAVDTVATLPLDAAAMQRGYEA
jgi:formate dehydrogenase maturation protein FdhE